jgi:alpha-L-rhamnosidase
MSNQPATKQQWLASWITAPNAPYKDYGVYHFIKTLHIKTVPESCMIHITADNRYRLFINEQAVNIGSVRSDLSYWYYDTIDIAQYLKQGHNIVAVQVWNMGDFTPISQISAQTALFIQGNSFLEKELNTDDSWRVLQNPSYSPCSLSNQARLNAYMVVGPGDKVKGNEYPWNWQADLYNDYKWEPVKLIDPPTSQFVTENNPWILKERNIPLFNEELLRFRVLRESNVTLKHVDLTEKNKGIIIPKNQTINILLDHKFITVAYPEINISGGKDASIQLIYAESLYDQDANKGNRNEIENKKIFGNYDIFISDGGIRRVYRPLSLRAYRYLQLNITTYEEPLIINDIYSQTVKYPFQLKASFKSNDESLKKIWYVAWRTAQLCAGEVYYDTPYYEQLQYVGDTRIQSLISLYTSGDDRLMRKAILDFYHSITPDGLTQSRYPSNQMRIIPGFSLFWISMIYDYWMHRKDDLFVKQFLPAICSILHWFKERIDSEKSMLGPLPYWNFVDWDNFDERGRAPGSENGNSSIITLHYSATLQQAADLCDSFENSTEAKSYRILSSTLNQNTFVHCYDEERELIADTPDKTSYSQHAGIWAILSGAIPSYARANMINQLMADQTIGQVTYYYRFYWVQALKKANMADLYYEQLTPWREMIKLGLTTFAEKPEPTRSDCHGWSASPIYDFLVTICGIMPSSPGFNTVLVKPALGKLESVEGSMPHPLGMISVKLDRQDNNGITARITLPSQLTGTFQWGDNVRNLYEGEQTITL